MDQCASNLLDASHFLHFVFQLQDAWTLQALIYVAAELDIVVMETGAVKNHNKMPSTTLVGFTIFKLTFTFFHEKLLVRNSNPRPAKIKKFHF